MMIPILFYLSIYICAAFVQCLVLFVFILAIVAYFTLEERQLIASIQRRQGPNIMGFFGLLQPISDALKLLTKEIVAPMQANYMLYYMAPIMIFVCCVIQWVLLPVGIPGPGNVLSAINLSLLNVIAFGSIGGIGLFLAGWSSNSKYALLGALRTISQMISYELALSAFTLCFATYTHSININDIVIIQQELIYFIIPLFLLWIIFFIITLAETNRSPVDLPEGESEIVAGVNLEYASIMFALFFLGEYAKIIAISIIHVILFIGGWAYQLFCMLMMMLFFSNKTFAMSYLFIYIRAISPRYRVDQLMSLGWKILLPHLFTSFMLLSLLIFVI